MQLLKKNFLVISLVSTTENLVITFYKKRENLPQAVV